MRNKIPELVEARTGLFGDHPAFLYSTMLARLDPLDATIAAVTAPTEAESCHFRR